MIKAEIVADSKNQFGNRLTTFVITFPRIILAEVNTHRMLSKNTASSRAIPFPKLVNMIQSDPFIPLAWQKEHKGMQGTEYHTDDFVVRAHVDKWLEARDNALSIATEMSSEGVTKQLCNRLIEPFMWCTMIISGTEWENFFHLRCPRYEFTWDHADTEVYRSKKDLIKDGAPYLMEGKDEMYWLKLNKGQAEIHMMALAECMWDAYNESKPQYLLGAQWHIPFHAKMDLQLLRDVVPDGPDCPTRWQETMVKISTTMAARTSYTVVGEDQKPMSYANMIALHDKLKDADPIHASPFEHCAYASNGWYGNFHGFHQYRKMIPGENKI